MHLTRLRSLAVAPMLALAACYVQQPLPTGAPAPETRIVAQVTDTGTVLMSNKIGPAAVEVEGIVASRDADDWNLRLVRVDHRGGSSVIWNQELVTFPGFALTNLRERRLDTTRSWMAGGLIVGGAFILARALGVASGDDIPIRNPGEAPAN